MKKNRVRWIGLTILSLVGILIVAGGRLSANAAAASPAGMVQRVWRNVQHSGVYDFRTEITQVTHPGPALANVGRSSTRETLSLSGHADLPAQDLQISLWDGSSGQGPASALHMRMQGARAYSRCPTCAEWEEIDDFRGTLLPGSDLMAYLAGAEEITEQETQSLLGVRVTRYTFEVDGPAFGEYMRRQMEDYLRERGELPGTLSLDVARQYVDMVGQGQLWITDYDLPLRLSVDLEFPTGTNGDWIEAEIRHDFSRFDMQWAQAPRPLDDPGGWIAAQLHRATGHAGDWHRAGVQAAVLMALAGLLALLIRYGRLRRVRNAVIMALVLIIVAGPLLQNQQVAAFSDRQAVKAAEEEARQREDQAAQDYQDLLANAAWDPLQSPWAQAAQSASPHALEKPLAQVSAALPTEPLPLPSAYNLWQEAGQETGDPESDEDGDTLTLAMERFLGTDPTSDDSDGDGITDDVEVAGFETNGQHWYLDPSTPDTNGDGLLDSLECPESWRLDPEEGLSPRGVCQDTDGDGTPDVFDRDNDGDGVSDRVDMAPGDAMGMGNPFTGADPFRLTVGNLATDVTTFVDIQLRPAAAEHLSYMYNVLDWPTGDSAGQIQRVLETTWRDQFAGGAQSDGYGDMRLIPMLEITIPHQDGHYGNLPMLPGAPPEIDSTVPITSWLDTGQLDPYGIKVNYKDAEANLLAYVPLKLVYDETGEGKAAFAARMVYRPSLADWGPAQEVRVVWLVQAVVDLCNLDTLPPTGEGELGDALYQKLRGAHCADPSNRIESVQVVHAYDEAWTLTGLAVREDHGMDLAVVLEDPTTDSDLNEDHNLWALANGLGESFLAGRDQDDDGQRDIDIAEIQHRFDNVANDSIPDGDARLWALDRDAYRVEIYHYPTQDYVAHIPMTVTLQVLDSHFMNGSTCLSETPLLLFAREEHFRSAALDSGADLVAKRADGRGLHIAMNGELAPNYTAAYMQWQTYRRANESWESYPLAEYYDSLYLELKDLLADQEFGPEDLNLEDTVLLAICFYVSLQQGASALVQGGSTPVNNPFAVPDGDLLDFHEVMISSYLDLYKKIADKIAEPIIKIMETVWGTATPERLRLYGLWYQAESGTLGRVRYTAVESWRRLTTSQVVLAAGAIIGGAVICLGLAVVANIFDIKPIIHIQNTIGLVFATMEAGKMLVSFVKLVQFAWRFKKTCIIAAEFSAAVQAAKGVTKAGVIGLILELSVTWAGFIMNWVLTGVRITALAFTAMLAQIIAQTIASIILFAIGCIPVVGQVIMAIVGLIDAAIWFICGFLPKDLTAEGVGNYICKGVSGLLTKLVGWLIYSQTILVDFENTDRLDIYNLDQRFVDPQRGVASGNSLAYSAAMTNTITMVPIPIDWKAAAYGWQYNLQELRSSTFDYAFALEEPEEDDQKLHNTAPLTRTQMSDLWVQVGDVVSRTLQMTDTVYIDSVPLPDPGLDQPLGLYLAEGFAVPAQECWAIPLGASLWIPVCYIRTYKDTTYIDMGQSFLFDVFPATLSEFYALAMVDPALDKDGGFRLAWDKRFPRLKDADGDGLLNKADGGADPNDSLWDADLDGLGDLYEVQHGSDPANADADGDWLSDRYEVLLGTDPRRADTDGDGLQDGEEVFHQLETGAWVGGWEIVYGYDGTGAPLRTRIGSDPLSSDGDGDGWTDFQEKAFGYHPGARNASTQLTFESELSELLASGVYTPTDGYVAPGDTLYLNAQVTNELMGRDARGLLSTETAGGLQTDIQPVTFALQPMETEAMSGTIAVRSDAATAQSHVDQVAGALITDPREESGEAVAWLHLDEAAGATTFADSSGAPLHDGACSAAACPQGQVEGAYGYAARFDGTDDHLTLGDFPIEGEITLAAWIKPEATDGLRNIIALGDGASPASGVVMRVRDGSYEAGSYDVVGNHLIAYPVPGADLNAWVHLVAVYDGAAWRLYRNGEPVASAEGATGAVYGETPWVIGARGDGSEGFFQGVIDEVTIDDTGFSPVQVQELYRRPVLHLALDEETGATLFGDSSGSNNVARAATDASRPMPGQEGVSQRAVTFDGHDKLILDDNPSLILHNPAFTLSAWVKPENSGDSAVDDSAQGLIGLNSGEAEAYPSLQIVGRRLRAGFSAEVDGRYRWYQATTGDLITREEWNHVVVTFDGERLRFYLNGQFAEEGVPQEPGTANAYPPNAPLYATDRLGIGRSNHLVHVYLDRLYDISDTSNYSFVTHVALSWNDTRLEGDEWENSLRDGETWTISQTLSADTLATLAVYTENWWENQGNPTYVGGHTYWADAPMPADDQVDIPLRPAWEGAYGTGIYGTLYTRYSNHAIPFRGSLDELRIYKRPLLVSDRVNEVEDLYHAGTIAMRLRLDEPPGASRFEDWTGQHPGSAPAGGASQPMSGIGGRVNQAVRFDGVDDRISVDLPLPPQYTLGAWVRFLGAGWAAGPYTILEFGDDAPWLGVNASGQLALHGSGGAVSGGSVPLNRWAHVAFTWDGARGQLYLDGEAVGPALTAATAPSSALGIGHGTGQAAWFGGIDDLIAYRRALDAAEIASLVGSAPQVMLHLEEDLLDSSGNDYHPTCVEGRCPRPDIKGRIGRAVLFDGVDDYLQLPSADTLGLPGQDWTISAWFKADALAAGGTHALVAQRPPTGDGLFLGIRDGKPALHAYGLDLAAETPIQPNAWYHIAWNVDLPDDGSGTATGAILLQGSVVTQAQFGYDPGSSGPVPVYLGGMPGGAPFHGVLDELTLYRRSLSTRVLREVYAYQDSWVEERVRAPIIIDADEPQSTLLSNGSIYPLRDTVMAIAAADPTSRVDTVQWRIGGDSWSDCPACADSDSSWCPTFDPTAAGEGRYSIQTRAIDAVGNVQSTPSSHTLDVDGQAPQASSTMAAGQVVPALRHGSLQHVRYVQLAGQAVDPLIAAQYAGSGVARVEVELFDAAGFSAGRGRQPAQLSGAPGAVTWALPYLFDEPDPTGIYTVRVTVEDRVGNQATTDLISIQVDAHPPLVAQAYPDLQLEAQSALTETTLTGNVVDDLDAAGNALLSAGVAGVEIAFAPAGDGSVFSEAAPELVLPFDRDWLADGSAFRDATDQALATVTTGDALNHAVTGQVGSHALHLDAGDRVEVNGALPLAGSSFTVEFWARSEQEGVVFRHGGDLPGKALLIGFTDSGGYIFSFDDSCASPVGSLQVPGGEWAHYAFVYDADAGRRTIYWRRADSALWNDLPIGQGSPMPYAGAGPITLGAGPLPGGCAAFGGDIDHLVVHTRALSLAELKATDSGWRDVAGVTLAAGGQSGTWQVPVPAGLEGLYEVRLRGRDNAGNVSAGDEGSLLWRGSIDTLAPRFTARREHLGEGSASKTRFSGYAEDFNLAESGFESPCPPQSVEREYFAAPWYTEVVSDSVPRLYRLSYTCEVGGYDYGVTSFGASDIYSHTVAELEGGLQALGSLTISDTATALDIIGSTAYLAMDTDGLAVVDASAADNPVLAAGPSTGGARTEVHVRDLTHDGSSLYLADPDAGVRLFDATQMQEATISHTGSSLDGGGASGYSYWYQQLAISGDGRYVAFASENEGLVSGAGGPDKASIFVKDTWTGQIECVSVGMDGAPIWAGSDFPTISGDGRYVAFYSSANISVRDRQAGTTAQVDTSDLGEGFHPMAHSSLSEDGSRLAFEAGTDHPALIYVADRADEHTYGQLRSVCKSTAGEAANRDCMNPAISGNGRYVVFQSMATNLDAADTNQDWDIFVHDLVSGTTRSASVGAGGYSLYGDTWGPSISADGSRIAFAYHSTDASPWQAYLVSNPPQGDPVLLSANMAGDPAASGLEEESVTIAPDGQGAAFTSSSDDLVPNDTAGTVDIFVRELSPVAQTVGLTLGGPADRDAHHLRLSNDRSVLAFITRASYEPLDILGGWEGWDIYIHDRDLDRDGIYDEAGDTRKEIVSVDASSAQAVAPMGDLFFAGTEKQLDVVDLSTPTQPIRVGKYPHLGLGDLACDDTHLYVVADSGGTADGLVVYTVGASSPYALTQAAWDTGTGKLHHRVVVVDGYAYVAGKDETTGATLLVYDVANPSGALTPVGSYSTPLNGQAVAVEGGYAYLAAGDTLHVLDVSTPSAPVAVGAMQLGAVIRDLQVADGSIYLLTDQFQVLRMAGGTEYPTTIVLSPAHGTVIDTAGSAVPISGWAYAENGSLASLAVSIDGVQHGAAQTWSAGEQSATWAVEDWTPAADGVYRIEAVSTDSTGGTLRDAVTVSVDTAAPAISLPVAVFTTAHYDPGAGQVDLTGRSTDAAGAGWLTATVIYDGQPLLALVEGDGGPAWADGAWTGYLYVDAAAPPDGSQGPKPLQATVADRAGRTATLQQDVLIDLVRPVTVTLGLSLGTGEALAPGAVLRQEAADLDLTWGASADAMGLAAYTVTWVDGQGQLLQQHDIAPDADRSDRLAASGPVRLTARLTSRDTSGNERVQSIGPVYLDGPATPDYVTLLGDDPPYHGWMESGATLIGTDRRINDNASKQAALWEEQRLYATWDGVGLRLAWTGADWSTDGDLLVLLDTIPGQGADQVPDLVGGAGSTIYLPETASTAMAADYLVWVRDAGLAYLYRWDGQSQSWNGDAVTPALGPDRYRFFGGLNGGHTDLYLPFDEIGIADPAPAAVEMVALATDEGALSLWSAMPPQNPVSSAKVNEFSEFGTGETSFGLLQSYRWAGLGDGLSPNGRILAGARASLLAATGIQGASLAAAGTSYLDVDLTLRVTTDPAGSVYGYLRDGLFWMWDALFAGDRPAELSESFDFMDPDHPALGDGRQLTYTFQAANRGRDPAQSAYAQLAAHYALRLLDGSGNRVDRLMVPLGDVGPGETVTVRVSGVVDLAHARDATYNGCLSAHPDDPAYCDRYLRWAQLDIRFYDAAHGEDGQPLDWVWVDHAVDPQAPQFYGLQSPRTLVSPTGARLSGYAYDNSAVDHVELDIDGMTGTAASEDHRWSYPWSLSGAQDGDEHHVRLRAVDEFGQAGAWMAARTLVVDATPPTVALDPLLVQNVAGRTLREDPVALSGTLSDNRGAGGVEVCLDGLCQKADTRLVRGEARSYDELSAQSIGGEASAVQVSFTVADSFDLGDIGLGLSIDHPYRDDLVATLTSPAGTTVRVLSVRRTINDTYAHYDRLLADAAPGDLFSWQGDDDPAEPAFDRLSRPYAPLGAFLGEAVHGTWTLRIWDVDTAQHAGAYRQARLILMPQDVEPRSGTWRTTLPSSLGVPDGERTIEIVAWDSVGNRTALPRLLTYRLDRTAPELAITGAQSAIVSIDPTPVLTGTVSDAGPLAALYATVEGPGGDTQQTPITWWQGEDWGYSLQPGGEGTYTLWIHAEDRAGNRSRLGPLELSVTAPPRPPEPQVLAWLSAGAEAFCPGSPARYMFRLMNIGDQALTNLTITDTVPAGACCPVGISEPGVVSADGGSVAWRVESLPVGETFAAMVTLTTPHAEEVITFTNVFTYSAAELPELGRAAIDLVADLDLCYRTTTTLTGTAGVGLLGAAMTFTATVAPLPPAVGMPVGMLTFYDGEIPLSEAVILEGGLATLITNTLAAGEHSLSAAFSGAGGWVNSQSTPLAYLVADPGFAVSKSPGPEPVPQQGPALFTVVLTNTGNVTLTVTANETLMDGVEIIESETPFALPTGRARTFTATVTGDFSGQATVSNVVTATAVYTDGAGNVWTGSATVQQASAACRVGSRANLLKWTQGVVDPTTGWTFGLWAGADGFEVGEALATSTSAGDLDGVLDFAGYNLDKNQAYTLCEEQVNAGWTSFWQVDSDGDADIDTDDAILIPYNPNIAGDPPADLGNRCVDLGAGTAVDLLNDGGTLLFMVNNTFPGGDPRSTGYWKNWSRCTGGRQQHTADANGGYMEGFWLLDDVLNRSVGGGITWDDIEGDGFAFPIEQCALAVDLLDTRDVADPALVADGVKMSSDGAYSLASQLLAAQLNLSAGARTCDEAFDTALAGEALLDKYDFGGSGSFLPGGSKDKEIKADYALALEIAAMLDQYNNGLLCSGPAVAFLAPLDGDVLAGAQTLQVKTVDTVPIIQVEFFVDGTWIGADGTASDGWSIAWDSASVPDGSHTLGAVATNNLGQIGSADVTVSVDNVYEPPVDNPPSVTITAPAAGALVSGDSLIITAEASDDNGVVQVEFSVDGLPIGADADGSDGWSATWDSSSVPDGSPTLTATATDTVGQTGSHSISVTVDNLADLPIRVASLAASSAWTKPNVAWEATVVVSLDPPVGGALVTGTWSNGEAGSCTSGADGTCSVVLSNIGKKASSVTFTVYDLALPGYTFDPSGPSSVEVFKPQ